MANEYAASVSLSFGPIRKHSLQATATKKVKRISRELLACGAKKAFLGGCCCSTTTTTVTSRCGRATRKPVFVKNSLFDSERRRSQRAALTQTTGGRQSEQKNVIINSSPTVTDLGDDDDATKTTDCFDRCFDSERGQKDSNTTPDAVAKARCLRNIVPSCSLR